jgi:3-hydroxyisobutyrate dehydrogenase-like beta-hydroxyacid dehydrogenase
MSDVTVLGQGAMGRALATALLAVGHQVTVWNRTPGRAAPGAVVAASPEAAAAASPLVVACVVDNAALRSVLTPDMVAGRTLVNLTNGTPKQARELAEEFGESYVDGGIMAVPPMIGQPGSLIFYSGSKDAFAETEPLLAVFGEARYLGEDPGRASLYDLALLSAMYGMFGGIDHALALGASADVPEAELRSMVVAWLRAMLAGQEKPADHAATYASLPMQAQAYVNLLDASREQGVRTDLVAPMGELLHRAVAAGPTHTMPDLLRTQSTAS